MARAVSLSSLTTLKIGGEAKYFFSATSEKEIRGAVAFAKKENLPIFVLGGGSNTLFSDDGFSGVVIQMKTSGIAYEKSGARTVARAAAGENWDLFVADTVSRGLWGIENLSGIPGTVGASPIQNIGAYGVEAKDVIESVRTLDSETGKKKIFSNADCAFGYRDSFFKTAEGKKYIVLEVAFRLSEKADPNISYKDLAEYFAKKKEDYSATGKRRLCSRLCASLRLRARTEPSFSVADIRNAVLEIRTRKFPDLSRYGTAGSFFKNPVVSQRHFDELKKKFPELPFFAAKNGLSASSADTSADEAGVKIPLAYILDKICGLKGFKKGKVGLFENQPLVLVTDVGATAKDVKNFSAEIKKAVFEKTGIAIEEEVVFAS